MLFFMFIVSTNVTSDRATAYIMPYW